MRERFCQQSKENLISLYRVSHRHAHQVWIDHSTTDHEQNKVFAEALSKSGGSLLEAPITGGLEALKKGQMAVWVAGDKVTLY